uniref:Dimethylallyl transferase n=1 Tax=Pastinaca sativa TaxID=4041 RepID=A0A4Y5WTK9_PASSA|nr:dimethylallyl transferase [Pastinaca sativa]
MTQTLMHSRFSSGFLHLQRRERSGFLTSFPTRRRHATILNKDKELTVRVVSCDKILDSTNNSSRSCEKPINRTNTSTLLQTLGASSEGEVIIQPKAEYEETWDSIFWRKWDAFVTFGRPYSVLGSIIGISSVSLLPLTSVGDFSLAVFVGFVQALIPFVCANIYASGINQVVDVEIDKINKPYLPLVSGDFSMGEGKAVVSATGFLCLAMTIMFGSLPLFLGVLGYFLYATAYSVELPFLRWKTKPFMAAFSMAGLMGLTIQPSVYYHIQNVLGRPMVLTKPVVFATSFISVFSAVLAMIKDLPDVEGDRALGNLTFSVRYGQEKVFNICVGIMLAAYASAVVTGSFSSLLICKLVSVIGHTALAFLLMLRAKSIDVNDPESTQSFYMFAFQLLYAEYVLIHFMR